MQRYRNSAVCPRAVYSMENIWVPSCSWRAIVFSREIEKTDAKNARGLRGEKVIAPFLRSLEFYFPLHWPCFRDVPTSWRACHRRGQRRLSVLLSAKRGSTLSHTRGTQHQFSQYICSEDEWRSRIFETFVVCLPPLGFSIFFMAEIFEELSFDPYDFRITTLSARKPEQMKKF